MYILKTSLDTRAWLLLLNRMSTDNLISRILKQMREESIVMEREREGEGGSGRVREKEYESTNRL